MRYDPQNRTFDCNPTLTDNQVLEFCRQGYLMLQGVVLDEINQRTCHYLDGKIEIDPFQIPDHMVIDDLERIRNTHEPSSILLEQWFLDQVILNPQVAGAIRSILGRNVGLPILMSNHRVDCPNPHKGGIMMLTRFLARRLIICKFFITLKRQRWKWVQPKFSRAHITIQLHGK